jgi:hypothetical protein
MKKHLMTALAIVSVLFAFNSCNVGIWNTDGNLATVSLSGNLTAIFDGIANTAGSRASLMAAVPITGTLTAENNGTTVTEEFDWYGTLDEAEFQIGSTKTVILRPGNYDFTLVLNYGTHQYIGAVTSQDILDGENTVDLTLQPVIGDTLIVTDLNEVASLRLSYPPNELSLLADPSMVARIDDDPPQILDIDPATGLSNIYINVADGTHTIDLMLFDDGVQIGKSIDAQETVTVVLGEPVHMDLIPLYGETVFDLILNGGDATFVFYVPPEVVAEAGGLSNLEALFTLTGPVNGVHERELSLSEMESGDYYATVVFPDFYYDVVNLTLAFYDISGSTPDLLGTSAVAEVALSTENVSVQWNLELRRRSFVIGNLLAVLGVNVFDGDDSPVAGAGIFVDGVFQGSTGAGTFATAGYLKLYLMAGNYTVEAQTAVLSGAVAISLSPLDVANVDIFVEVTVVNDPPVADAGTDLNVDVGSVAILDGTGSYDPNGDPLYYEWTLFSLPPGSSAVLVDPTLVTASFVPDIVGEYAVSLIVNDGVLYSDEVVIVVFAAEVVPPSGLLVGWGFDPYGETHVPPEAGFVEVSAGTRHSLGLRDDGSIVGWGNNAYGQLNAPSGFDFVAVAASGPGSYQGGHSLALRADGTIIGWGYNAQGQTNTPPSGGFIAIAAGDLHSLALRSDGTIFGWGSNSYGETNIPFGGGHIAISAGSTHSLAIRSDGSIVAWGSNFYGERNVPGGLGFIAVEAGELYSLALKGDGTLYGWGYNPEGQASPPGGNDFVAVSAGGHHAIALRNDASLVAWGFDNAGRTDVPPGNDYSAVSAGGYFNIAIRN